MMFPLQRGNELVIQFCNSPHQQQQEISQDLILQVDDSASLDVNDSLLPHHNLLFTNNNISSHHSKKEDGGGNNNSNSTAIDHHKKKKMVHREIEKQRRQEMATLYSSLRSLLPLHFIKGKRSICEHMNEAVNYIKHKQKSIKELGAKRDELKKLIIISNNLENNLNDDYDDNNNYSNNPTSNNNCSFISVHENNNNSNNNCVVGIEIKSGIIGEKEEGLIVSKLMQLLLEEGLEVVTYISSKVNARLVHSLQCEVVDNSSSVDLSELRRKIANLI